MSSNTNTTTNIINLHIKTTESTSIAKKTKKKNKRQTKKKQRLAQEQEPGYGKIKTTHDIVVAPDRTPTKQLLINAIRTA